MPRDWADDWADADDSAGDRLPDGTIPFHTECVECGATLAVDGKCDDCDYTNDHDNVEEAW